jgi:molybdopterin-guanine dinucleotide biosynthesis protein A
MSCGIPVTGALTRKCSVYDRCVENVTAFILAGGKSSRMGADKAFLELGGQTLLARAFETAGGVTPLIRLLGEKQRFAGFGTVIEDIYPGRGPLGGFHAGLMNTTTDFNLMLAVDLPFISIEFLRYLVSQAEASNAAATVPCASGIFQPLCAVYRKEFGGVAERSLLAGKNKIGTLFAEVNTRIIEENELANAGFTIEIFRNLNTPAEWQEAKLELEKKS